MTTRNKLDKNTYPAGTRVREIFDYNDDTGKYESRYIEEEVLITIDPPPSYELSEEESLDLYKTGEHKLRHLQQESLRKMFKLVFGI